MLKGQTRKKWTARPGFEPREMQLPRKQKGRSGSQLRCWCKGKNQLDFEGGTSVEEGAKTGDCWWGRLLAGLLLEQPFQTAAQSPGSPLRNADIEFSRTIPLSHRKRWKGTLNFIMAAVGQGCGVGAGGVGVGG